MTDDLPPLAACNLYGPDEAGEFKLTMISDIPDQSPEEMRGEVALGVIQNVQCEIYAMSRRRGISKDFRLRLRTLGDSIDDALGLVDLNLMYITRYGVLPYSPHPLEGEKA